MNEYKLTVVNHPNVERIVSALAELMTKRDGLIVTDVKVVRK